MWLFCNCFLLLITVECWSVLFLCALNWKGFALCIKLLFMLIFYVLHDLQLVCRTLEQRTSRYAGWSDTSTSCHKYLLNDTNVCVLYYWRAQLLELLIIVWFVEFINCMMIKFDRCLAVGYNVLNVLCEWIQGCVQKRDYWQFCVGNYQMLCWGHVCVVKQQNYNYG